MCMELNQIDTVGKIFLLKEVTHVNKFPFINAYLVLTVYSKFYLARFFLTLLSLIKKSSLARVLLST